MSIPKKWRPMYYTLAILGILFAILIMTNRRIINNSSNRNTQSNVIKLVGQQKNLPITFTGTGGDGTKPILYSIKILHWEKVDPSNEHSVYNFIYEIYPYTSPRSYGGTTMQTVQNDFFPLVIHDDSTAYVYWAHLKGAAGSREHPMLVRRDMGNDWLKNKAAILAYKK